MLFGLDIGGTNLKAARVSPAGDVAETVTVPAGGQIPRDALLGTIAETVRSVAGRDPVTRVGIAVGGLVYPDGAMRDEMANLPNLAHVPLAETFSDLLGAPCRVENDANAAMRGEAWLGAARGLRNAMTMTFGTAIGSGLLIDARIHAGANNGAGEIGLWRMGPPPASGTWLTLEEIAAPAAIERHRGRNFTALFDDRNQVLRSEFELIGRAIANADLLLDLEAVVLVGAVTALGEPFRTAVEQAALNAVPSAWQSELSVRLGELGAYSGAIGAAALWLEDDSSTFRPD